MEKITLRELWEKKLFRIIFFSVLSVLISIAGLLIYARCKSNEAKKLDDLNSEIVERYVTTLILAEKIKGLHP